MYSFISLLSTRHSKSSLNQSRGWEFDSRQGHRNISALSTYNLDKSQREIDKRSIFYILLVHCTLIDKVVTCNISLVFSCCALITRRRGGRVVKAMDC